MNKRKSKSPQRQNWQITTQFEDRSSGCLAKSEKKKSCQQTKQNKTRNCCNIHVYMHGQDWWTECHDKNVGKCDKIWEKKRSGRQLETQESISNDWLIKINIRVADNKQMTELMFQARAKGLAARRFGLSDHSSFRIQAVKFETGCEVWNWLSTQGLRPSGSLLGTFDLLLKEPGKNISKIAPTAPKYTQKYSKNTYKNTLAAYYTHQTSEHWEHHRSLGKIERYRKCFVEQKKRKQRKH